LQQLGIEARIDHRSLEQQGIEREPQSHLGPAVSGMERRGIETEVGKRLQLEALAAAQVRIEKAAELGRLERETVGLERSILDLSGDLEGAKRERDQQLAKSQDLARPKPSIEQLQREGREAWLAMRAEQKAAELVMAQTPEQVVALVAGQVIEKGAEKSLESERKPKLSIDEEQARRASAGSNIARLRPSGHRRGRRRDWREARRRARKCQVQRDGRPGDRLKLRHAELARH